MQQQPMTQQQSTMRPTDLRCHIGNGLMGYAVEWSPFDGQRLAISASQNFGIIGTGEQIVARYQNGMINIESRVRCKDGVFDCAWSESNPNHIVSACGDGSIMLIDTSSSSVMNVWSEHAAEVYSVDWNLANRENIVSGSWDYSVKLWHPSHSQSIRTYREHNQCVYASQWHPRHADIFASCAGDGLVKIWSMNDPRSVQTINAHSHECLTLDFNKYNEHELITGSVDRSIRGWDRRNPHRPLFQLDGHAFAVRRVKCSPHSPSVIGSVSYDMSFILWDSSQENSILAKREDHTEFVLGIDFNNFDPTLIATASWDETVHVYRIAGREAIHSSTQSAQIAMQEVQNAVGMNNALSSSSSSQLPIDQQQHIKPIMTHAEQPVSHSSQSSNLATAEVSSAAVNNEQSLSHSQPMSSYTSDSRPLSTLSHAPSIGSYAAPIYHGGQSLLDHTKHFPTASNNHANVSSDHAQVNSNVTTAADKPHDTTDKSIDASSSDVTNKETSSQIDNSSDEKSVKVKTSRRRKKSKFKPSVTGDQNETTETTVQSDEANQKEDIHSDSDIATSSEEDDEGESDSDNVESDVDDKNRTQSSS